MLSQFFILSPRGDVIIRRDYLGNVPRSSHETFFRKARTYKGSGEEAPPIFIVHGVTYLHFKDGGVDLVVTTRENASPSFVLEFLKRISVIIKDYCGSLSEDAIRRNFALIYELLDEAVDYGAPQSTATEALRDFVLNEPVVVVPPASTKASFGSLARGPTGVFKSVLDTTRADGSRRDEVFVDVIERLTATFNASGRVVSAQVDGAIQVKSYLAGNPPLKLKLNDGLLVSSRVDSSAYGSAYGGFSAADYASDAGLVVLDDVSFHAAADLSSFESERSISLVPPDGQFDLVSYRSSQGLRPPFRLQLLMDADPGSAFKAQVSLKLWADIPADKAASGLEVELPLPRAVQRVHCDIEPRCAQVCTWDYTDKTRLLRWRFKKLPGGSDVTLAARLTLEGRPYGPGIRSEVGPVNLRFTIPMYSTSGMTIKFLQILKRDRSYNPQRWVRYVTTSNSYTFRT